MFAYALIPTLAVNGHPAEWKSHVSFDISLVMYPFGWNHSKQEALRELKLPPHLVGGAWNSLFRRETLQAIATFVHILKIPGISIHPSLRNVANKLGSKNIKKITLYPRVKRIIPKIFQIVPCVTANVSGKRHENVVIHFTVMLLTDTLRRLDWRPWNGLGRHETVKIITYWVVPVISW